MVCSGCKCAVEMMTRMMTSRTENGGSAQFQWSGLWFHQFECDPGRNEVDNAHPQDQELVVAISQQSWHPASQRISMGGDGDAA